LAWLLGAAFPAAAQSVPLLSITHAWKYDATTNDYGTAWKEIVYDDALWSGPSNAVFLYDTSLAHVVAPTNTVVPLLYTGARIRAYYYRTTFQFPTNPAGALLFASNLVDDGAVFWLNGQEAGRLRMPEGVIARTNLATGVPFNGDATNYEVLILTNYLVAGANTLAVEVHQNSPTSPDTMFGLSLTALLPLPPVITDDSQLTNRTVVQGRSTTLTLAAGGLPAPTYQWFLNDNPIPGATSPSYAITNMTEADGGSYFCQVANAAGFTNSRTAIVFFEADTVGPALVYALADATLTNVLVSFSEPLEPNTAVDYFNYSMVSMDGTQVLDLEQRNGTQVNATNVLLSTLPRAPGVYYRLVVNGVSDAQGNPIVDYSSIPISGVAVAGDQQTWSAFQSDTDPGAGWPEPGFDDRQAPWINSPAAFYAHNGAPVMTVPLRTKLEVTNPPTATNFVITYYFRARFVSAGYVGRLQLRYLVDDGAVFYLNGREIHRVRMPAQPVAVSYSTYAATEVTDALVRYEGPVDVPCGSLVDGENVLAVEVHQAATGTPDMYFAAELIATGATGPASRVQPLPALSGRTFMVTWGPETGGGNPAAGYDVWAATNGGSAGLWLAGTAATSAMFRGEAGATYSFYSVLRDASGPVETAPLTPDAQTTVATNGPVLEPVADQNASAGQVVVVTNVVQGTAVGAYRFSLGAGAPSGARINTATGVFQWMPACGQGGTTNEIMVWVTDSGAPNLSDATSFRVAVADCVAPGLGSIPLPAGTQGEVPLQVFCTTPITNLSLTIDYPAARLINFAITGTAPGLCSNAVEVVSDGRCLVRLETCAGQWLQGRQQLGMLQVTAVSNQASAFVPLDITEVRAGTLDGRVLTPEGTAQDGRVAVVADEPLLEAWLGPDRQPMLNLYGKTGTNYAVESTPMLVSPVVWLTEQNVVLTNVVQPVSPRGTTNAAQWYRAQER